KGQELRHLDGAKGNFAIVDRTEYTNILVQEEGERPTQALISNVRSFVQQQQYSFDALWQKAIPAQERIKEIEEGIKPDFIETIRDPIEIQKIGFGLVKSAMKDILILFSTPDSFSRQIESGLRQLLKEVAIQKNVRIRILVHISNEVREILNELKLSANIEFRNLQD